MKPYYEDPSGIVIYHGRCEDVLSSLPEVDVVLTDPPYGIAHPTDYKRRGRSVLAECRDYAPVFDDDKPFDPAPWLKWPCLLFGANYFADKLPNTSGWIVWDKMRPEELDQATAELAWTNFVKGVRVFRFLWNGMLRASDEELQHPTQKPVALMTWILGLRWTPAGTVLDPYMGSGTTLVACKRLNRRAIGIEVSEAYCEIAARRLQEASMPLLDGIVEPRQEMLLEWNAAIDRCDQEIAALDSLPADIDAKAVDLVMARNDWEHEKRLIRGER